MRLLAITLPVAYLLSLRYGEYGLHYTPVIAALITTFIAVTWILTAVNGLERKARPVV